MRTISRKVDGSGWYLLPKTKQYVAFRFVDWPWTPTSSENTWEPESNEKFVDLDPRKFADAKALVRFVAEQWKAQSQAGHPGS